MKLVCKTLAFVERPETVKIVTQAFPNPQFELEFVNDSDETIPLTSRADLFVVDSKFLNDKRVAAIKHHLPTVVIEPEYIHLSPCQTAASSEGSLACGEKSDTNKESEKIRIAAEKLLRKNYFNWIIDALEYSS